MPWPPRQPSRDEITIGDLAAYAQVIERQAASGRDAEKDAGFFGRLLLAPRMAAAQSSMGSVVRTNGDRVNAGYSHADREWIDHVCAVRFHSNVLLGLHLPDALAAGVRLEAIISLRAGHEDELLPRERLLTSFIDALLSGTMTPEIWNALEDDMGEAGVVEYTIAIIYISGGTRLQKAVGMPDPSNAEIDGMLQEFLKGQREVPDDWRKRNA